MRNAKNMWEHIVCLTEYERKETVQGLILLERYCQKITWTVPIREARRTRGTESRWDDHQMGASVTVGMGAVKEPIVERHTRGWPTRELSIGHWKRKTGTLGILWLILGISVYVHQLLKTPCTERYTRRCERTAANHRRLLDFSSWFDLFRNCASQFRSW